jgi:hypothetical protein
VNVETAQAEVIQAMRRIRKIPADKENDFELSSPIFSAISGTSLPAPWLSSLRSSAPLACWLAALV